MCGKVRPVLGLPDNVERRLRLVNLWATLCMAWVQLNPFQADEHFQIVELAAYKLGLLPRSCLAWELGYEVRPFFQPLLEYLFLRAVRLVPGIDVFSQLALLRMAFAAFAFFALDRFVRVSAGWLPGHLRATHAKLLYGLGFLPWLAARPCSEVVATSFFVLGLCELLPAALEKRRPFVAGLLLGAAVETRFQTAFLLVGLLAWLLGIDRRKLSELGAIAVGGIVLRCVGALADRWGYGHWVFPPYHYYHVNMVEGVANAFSTAPFTFYFLITWANLFLPSALLVFVSLFVLWARKPKHVLTWVTLPFFLVHDVLLAHKEERFLWPLGILGAAGVVLAWGTAEGRGLGARIVRRIYALKDGRAFQVLAAANFAVMLLMMVYPLNWAEHIVMAKGLYRNSHDGDRLVVEAPAESTHFNLFRRAWAETHLDDKTGPCCPFEGEGPVLVVTSNGDGPLLPFPGARELVFTEWPFGASLLGLRRTLTEGGRKLHEAYGDARPIRYYDLWRVTPAANACKADLPRCAPFTFQPVYVRPPPH